MEKLTQSQTKDFDGAAWRYIPILKENFNFSDNEMCTLLGGMPRSTYANGTRKQDVKLTKDQMDRVSLLLGIQSALLVLFSGEKERAFGWINRKNALQPFDGMSPREFIANGDIQALFDTRKMLESSSK